MARTVPKIRGHLYLVEIIGLIYFLMGIAVGCLPLIQESLNTEVVFLTKLRVLFPPAQIIIIA